MKRQQKTTTQISILIAVAVIIVYAVFSFLYLGSVKKNTREQTLGFLSEITKQGVDVVRTQVNGDFHILESISGIFKNDEELDWWRVYNILETEMENSTFKRMGIILPNGRAYLTDGYSYDFSDRDYFHLAMQGVSNVSNTLVDKIDEQYINVYATPIYHGNEVQGVLFATHNSEVFKKLLGVSMFGGHGYSYIVRSNGAAVVRSQHPSSVKDFSNLFINLENTTEGDKQEVIDMRNAMAEGRGGTLVYTYEGVKKYAAYEPIGVNDWFIYAVVPAEIASKSSDYIVFSTARVTIVTIALFAGLLFYTVQSQKKSKKNLEKIAFRDGLTGGSNWNKFSLDCRAILDNNKDTKYALMNFDIDKFKIINDMVGHQNGNVILQGISQILVEEMRVNETFARVSSDNFDILMHYTNEGEIVQRLHEILKKVQLLSDLYTIQLSFGIYPIADPNLDINLINDRASLAKRTIKEQVDVIYAFYTDAIRDAILKEKEIEDRMEQALENGEFQMYLQPKILFETDELVGAEALVRWIHPKNGLIPPDAFIPLFEKNGFVRKIDLFIYTEACKAIKQWRKDSKNPMVVISVNLSRLHLNTPTIAHQLKEIASTYGVPTSALELELTESTVFENTHKLVDIMSSIKEAGFSISIDDFGSGYSSLNLLKDLPADVLKIDKGFLGQASDSNRGQMIIANVVHMAKDLNITTVAEGVETLEQVDFLRTIGCDIAQGYYYSRPLPIAEFERKYSLSQE